MKHIHSFSTPSPSPSFEYSKRRSSRRKGQALLLAVLLMVFAAVLGATFITVVALNLSQTARSGSVASARQAALAGKNFVNEQLTNSEKGERWTEIDVQTPPLAGDPEYAFYYTDFERAQGWASTDTEYGYAKFPNPLSPTATANGSSVFLTKVQEVNAPNVDDQEHDFHGQLKVTVIGRATDNDATFSRLTFFKPTSKNGNMNSFARYVSNWDFGKNRPVITTLSNNVTASATLILASTRGLVPGRSIAIGSADNPATIQVRVVRQVLSATQLVVNQNVTANSGVPVRAASPFMGALGTTASLDSTGRNGLLTASMDTPSQTATGGIKVHGALYFDGANQLAMNANTTGTNPFARSDQIDISGIIVGAANATVLDANLNGGNPVPITSAGDLQPFIRYKTSEGDDPTRPQSSRPLTPVRLDKPFSKWLNLTRYTGDFGAEYGYGAGVYIDNKDDVEKVSVVRNVGAYGRVSWRALTIAETQRLLLRKSFPALTNEIGNVADTSAPANVVYSTTDLTKGEYASGTYAHRLTYPRVVPNPSPLPSVQPYSFPLTGSSEPTPTPTPLQDPSLEERGVRGWISPTEFLPRGALIELQGNRMVITRDDQNDESQWSRDSDGDVLNQAGNKAVDASVAPVTTNGLQRNLSFGKPWLTKAWKTPTGADITNPAARTYRMAIDITTGQRSVGAEGSMVDIGVATPFKGVVFAEGNVRVRGFSSADITIVSMGNIYIEGSINQTGGHVALLAKRNVVLNPTQFVAPPSGWQPRFLNNSSSVYSPLVAINSNATPTVALPVNDATRFRVGDRIKVGSASKLWVITEITLTNVPTTDAGNLSLSNPNSETLVASDGTFVRVLTDPPLRVDGTERFVNMNSDDPQFLRNLALDGVALANAPSIGLIHAGQIRRELSATRGALGGTSINVKLDADSDGTIQDAEKLFDAVPDSARSLTTAPTATIGDLISSYPVPAPPALSTWTLSLGANGNNAAPSHRLAATTGSFLSVGSTREFLGTVSYGGYWQSETVAAPTPQFVIGSSFDPTEPEDIAPNNTVRETFYGTYDPLLNTFTQANLQTMIYPLLTAPLTNGENILALRRDSNAAANTLADYRVLGVKYDRATFAGVAADPIPVNIQATIYAQEGSWFIIPVPAMTPNSLAPNNAEANRSRRLNYKINVKASISENYAPTGSVDYDNEQTPDQNIFETTSRGAQNLWLDASAYPVSGAETANNGVWQTINYVAPDPLPTNHSLYLPITPDITLQR